MGQGIKIKKIKKIRWVLLKLVGIMQELIGFNESSLTQFEGQVEATQLFSSVDPFGCV